MPFDASLYFPQWQGCPNPKGVGLGGPLLRQALAPHIRFHDIPVDTSTSNPQRGIWHYPALIANLKAARATLKSLSPRRVFTLGGDCSVDVATIDYLRKRYGKSLGVIWIDAHADINTPESSPSKYFHGMPLRTLLGEGDNEMVGMLSSPLNHSQLCYAGIRSIDPPEQDYITEHALPVLTASEINRGQYQTFLDWRAKNNIEHLHIHFDLDVLDPTDAISVTYRVEGGIRYDAMATFLTFLHGQNSTVGFTLTEYAPTAENMTEIDKILGLLSCVVPLRKILAA